MNWFKKTFGKRNWKTIYSKALTVNCDTYNTIYGWSTRKEVDGYFIVKVDLERGEYQCYLTDGNTKTHIVLEIAVLQFPDLADVLKQHDLTF